MPVAVLILVGYFLLKWLAYSWWSKKGLGHVEPERRWRFAMVWGAGRVILGLGFGWLIFLGVMKFSRDWREVAVPVRTALVYLATYAPAHWLSWGIVGTLMRPAPREVSAVFVGFPKWRLGGLLLSGVLDVVFILVSGDAGNMRFG